MGCNCKPKNYNFSMGCCQPVLGPIENYYTKSQTDRVIEEAISGITGSTGCCITPEEVESAITSAMTIVEGEIPTVPTSNTAFTNDAGYLTEHQPLKTINGESLVGEGNIEITGGSGITSGEVQSMIDSSISGKVNVSDNEVPVYYYNYIENRYFPSKDGQKYYFDNIDKLTISSNYNHYMANEAFHITIKLMDSSWNILSGSTSITGEAITASNVIPSELNGRLTASVQYNSWAGLWTINFTAASGYMFSSVEVYVERDGTEYGQTTISWREYKFDSGQTRDVVSALETAIENLDKNKQTNITPKENGGILIEDGWLISVTGKQDTLIAGENITISGNVISATGGGGGGTTYTAGDGIDITNNVISTTTQFACVSEAEWETISGNPQSNTVYLIY